MYIYIHTLQIEWETAAESDDIKKKTKREIRQGQDHDNKWSPGALCRVWLVPPCFRQYCLLHTQCAGKQSLKIIRQRKGNQFGLCFEQNWDKFECPVPCNPMKVACTTQFAKGEDSVSKDFVILLMSFSLSREIKILNCFAEGYIHLAYSKGKQKGSDFIWMCNFSSQNRDNSTWNPYVTLLPEK